MREQKAGNKGIAKSDETRDVSYTCWYTSGQSLIQSKTMGLNVH